MQRILGCYIRALGRTPEKQDACRSRHSGLRGLGAYRFNPFLIGCVPFVLFSILIFEKVLVVGAVKGDADIVVKFLFGLRKDTSAS